MKSDATISALIEGIKGWWFSEPRRLKGAYLWTEQDRDAVLSSKSRRKGILYVRTAAAHTPSEEIHVVIVPDLAIGEDAVAFPHRRLMIVPYPDTLGKLAIYLHECGHVENDYEKNRFVDRKHWIWLDEIEAEFFMVQAIARSKIHWLNKAAVEKMGREYMLKQLENSGMDEPKQYLKETIAQFIEGENLVFTKNFLTKK